MCADCEPYRLMAEEWRARVVAKERTTVEAFEAGFRASGVSVTAYRERMEKALAAFLAKG